MTSPDRLYELPPSNYQVVAPLFAGVWIDRALIDAVLEGAEPARVFADDPALPQTALLCCEAQGDYVVAGGTPRGPGGPVRRFIKDLPPEAGVFDRPRYAFFLPQPAWGDALREDFDGRIPVYPTRSFRYGGARVDPVARWLGALELGVLARGLTTREELAALVAHFAAHPDATAPPNPIPVALPSNRSTAGRSRQSRYVKSKTRPGAAKSSWAPPGRPRTVPPHSERSCLR